MASKAPRQRSNTSISTSSGRRPKSRASTTSAQSANAPLLPHYRHASESAAQVQPQYHHHTSLQPTPEDMIRRSEQQLMDPHSSYGIDPAFRNQSVNGLHIGTDGSFHGHQLSARPYLEHYHSYDGKENQLVENANDDFDQDETGVEGKKKKGSASSIANDLELRRLFRENEGRPLKEVAAQVLANERGPRAEKTKQIFAMLWLDKVCKRGSSSVPRSRVFSHYATRCGTERVPVLNAASFGKLVRIIFPGISTRRLGMRGESKYHYVELSLQEDENEDEPSSVDHPQISPDLGTAFRNKDLLLERSHATNLHTDAAIFPSPGHFNAERFHHSYLTPAMSLYVNPNANSVYEADLVRHELRFESSEVMQQNEDGPITLPSIHSFTPEGTDNDVAESLTAVYRSHCVSVIDCFRFCKEKMFWHHFTSFHGTLTAPAQKLLAHADIAPWIKECDWLMYQKMVRFVAPLAMQAVPLRVLDTFKSISKNLVNHLLLTFASLPHYVKDAKLGPATIFASLLQRLLRVNASAHAAANLLTHDANRNQMWHDWVTNVNPLDIAGHSVPECGHNYVVDILTREMRHILSPLNTDPKIEAGTIYEATNKSFPQQYSYKDPADTSAEGVLDRWSTMLHTLPDRFPGVDVRLVLWCANMVGSAVLRDITMASALSFGTWTIVKVWVDEMLLWLAEKGGFMERSPLTTYAGSKRRVEWRFDPRFGRHTSMNTDVGCGIGNTAEVFGESRPMTAASNHTTHNRCGSADTRVENFDTLSGHQRAGNHQQTIHLGSAAVRNTQNGEVQITFNTQAGYEHIHNQDDSGIGLGIEDEDLGMTKDSFVFDGVNIGSDPVDVTVC